MPGRKDCVSIKRNIHQQKRHILCNLNELFRPFKEQNPTVSLGFSKFCSLSPKWCVLAGSAGTHAICVCTIHQNMKLLLEPLNVKYQDLMKYIVCNTSSRECMIHRCPNCPKSSGQLEKFLSTCFHSFIGLLMCSGVYCVFPHLDLANSIQPVQVKKRARILEFLLFFGFT